MTLKIYSKGERVLRIEVIRKRTTNRIPANQAA